MSESSSEPSVSVEFEAALSESAENESEDGPKRIESKELRDLQHVERHLSKAAHRVSRAVTRGIGEYRKQQRKSASAEKDGAVFDMPYNVAKGVAKATVEMSRLPLDLVKAADTPTNRKLARLSTRIMFFPFAR